MQPRHLARDLAALGSRQCTVRTTAVAVTGKLQIVAPVVLRPLSGLPSSVSHGDGESPAGTVNFSWGRCRRTDSCQVRALIEPLIC